MIEWLAGSAFVLGIGVACYAFYRTGYLRGWADCLRRVRENQQLRQTRKPADLATERLRRRLR